MPIIVLGAPRIVVSVRLMLLSLLAVLLLGSAATPTAVSHIEKLHPALTNLLVQDATASSRVIVQHGGNESAVREYVSAAGGQVVKSWHIMPALVAELPVGALPALAEIKGVRWISPDGPVFSSSNGRGNGGGSGGGDGGGGGTSELPTTSIYLESLRVPPVWEMGLTGSGIGVAVIDSGVTYSKDFEVDPTSNAPHSRVRIREDYDSQSAGAHDHSGHGTHVAGIIAGGGFYSGGDIRGIAPEADIISLRVSNAQGMSLESDVVDALQFVLDHRVQHNIRVVNLSLNASTEQSYHVSPINAAVEILWFNEIVVVVAAGNLGGSSGANPIKAAPANDPFVITVGATDENMTAVNGDDTVASFSAFGVTQDGFRKPEIYAPGRHIVSVLASNSDWDEQMPERAVGSEYIRLSGTSMAAPMVSGAVALLLEDEPNLTPDQIKYRLINAGGLVTDANGRSQPYLNVYMAVNGNTTQSANTGIDASQLLWTGSTPVTWNSVAWNSVAWNSVAWNSVAWNSVAWNSVAWNSVYWNDQ